MSIFDYDVVVVGGGPAGATTAALLSQEGHSVLVLERERFPRFHIGESLLPEGNMVLDLLGVTESVAELGVKKRGATFTHESGTERCSIVFANGDDNLEVAAHVERSKFDQLLLERAEALGSEVRQETAAREVAFSDDGVEVELVEGGKVTARYLVDASGQSGFLAKRLDLRQPISGLELIAIFSHYEGVGLSDGLPPGDIEIVSRSDMGWVWLIPISDTVTSVGLVMMRSSLDRDLVAEREEWLEEWILQSPAAAARMAGARRVSPVRVAADYSYTCSRYAGERWLAVGDAGSFLDPVFSTGVLLALESGAEAAMTLDEILRGEVRPSAGLAAYERYQRERFKFFRRWVEGFYDPAFRDLLCQPTKRFGLVPALISVLAGNHQPGLVGRFKLFHLRMVWWLQRRFPLAKRVHR